MKLLHPSSWSDYELIDSGDFEKLERFGKFILIRPEPQAIWRKVLGEDEWKKLAHARFVREQKDNFRFTDDIKGGWSKTPAMPDVPLCRWQCDDQKNQMVWNAHRDRIGRTDTPARGAEYRSA